MKDFFCLLLMLGMTQHDHRESEVSADEAEEGAEEAEEAVHQDAV